MAKNLLPHLVSHSVQIATNIARPGNADTQSGERMMHKCKDVAKHNYRNYEDFTFKYFLIFFLFHPAQTLSFAGRVIVSKPFLGSRDQTVAKTLKTKVQ